MNDHYRCPRCGQFGIPSAEQNTCTGCANHIHLGSPDPKILMEMMNASTEAEPSKHECPGCGWKGEWQTHAVRESVTRASRPPVTMRTEYFTAFYRICGRCGYIERKVGDGKWEDWS